MLAQVPQGPRLIRIQDFIHELSELSILWHINHVIWSSYKPHLGQESLSVSVFCISPASTVSGFPSFSLFAFSSVGPKLPAVTDLRTKEAAWLFVAWPLSVNGKGGTSVVETSKPEGHFKIQIYSLNIGKNSSLLLLLWVESTRSMAIAIPNPLFGKRARKFTNLTNLHWANYGKTNVNSC